MQSIFKIVPVPRFQFFNAARCLTGNFVTLQQPHLSLNRLLAFAREKTGTSCKQHSARVSRVLPSCWRACRPHQSCRQATSPCQVGKILRYCFKAIHVLQTFTVNRYSPQRSTFSAEESHGRATPKPPIVIVPESASHLQLPVVRRKPNFASNQVSSQPSVVFHFHVGFFSNTWWNFLL